MTSILARVSVATCLAALVVSTVVAQDKPAPSGPAVDVVNRFYDAFKSGDQATLKTIYSPNVTYHDTLFAADGRDELMGLWSFELDPSLGTKITPTILSATPDGKGNTVVQAKWNAKYSFIGNPVDHDVYSTLTVDPSGKIVSHVESWDWSQWAHEALPFLGSAVDMPILRPVIQAAVRSFGYAKAGILGDRIEDGLGFGPKQAIEKAEKAAEKPGEMAGKTLADAATRAASSDLRDGVVAGALGHRGTVVGNAVDAAEKGITDVLGRELEGGRPTDR